MELDHLDMFIHTLFFLRLYSNKFETCIFYFPREVHAEGSEPSSSLESKEAFSEEATFNYDIDLVRQMSI